MTLMLLMFDSCASPVMVQGGRKRRKTFCFEYEQACPLDAPFVCKVMHRKRTSRDQVDGRAVSVSGGALDPSMDFSFLHNHQTVQVIRRSKIMFIMRGLPGSGKSTIVRAITDTYEHSVVCSADDFFLRDGVYSFDVAGLSSAHSACQNKAADVCNAGVPVVVVDNTNVKRWEMKNYLDLASQTDYVVVLVEPRTSWRLNPVELAARNKHGVSLDILKKKVSQFDDVIPMYYAWFLNDDASKQLCFISNCLLKECSQKFSAFTERLLKERHISPWQQQASDPCSISDTVQRILSQYYTKGKRSGSLVHCTAKYLGYRGKAEGGQAYHARENVQRCVGKAFMLEITSICFSPRTVGARVHLTKDQMSLFDKPEEREWNGRQLQSSSPRGLAFSSLSLNDSAEGSDSSAQNGKQGGGKKNGKSPRGGGKSPRGGMGKAGKSGGEGDGHFTGKTSSWSQSSLKPAFTKPLAKQQARSAHITVGVGLVNESRETNFDVLRLCDMEEMQRARAEDFVSVAGGRARYFGDGVCCVYFDPPLHVSAIYSGSY